MPLQPDSIHRKIVLTQYIYVASTRMHLNAQLPDKGNTFANSQNFSRQEKWIKYCRSISSTRVVNAHAKRLNLTIMSRNFSDTFSVHSVEVVTWQLSQFSGRSRQSEPNTREFYSYYSNLLIYRCIKDCIVHEKWIMMKKSSWCDEETTNIVDFNSQ